MNIQQQTNPEIVNHYFTHVQLILKRGLQKVHLYQQMVQLKRLVQTAELSDYDRNRLLRFIDRTCKEKNLMVN